MKSQRDPLRLITILSIGIFTGMMILLFPTELSAQDSPASITVNNSEVTSLNGTTSTTGTAYARLQPDKVYVTIGIENTEDTANMALSVNSKLMNGIISALRNQGLMQNESSTSSFNIYPIYNFTESGARLNISGFTVLNSILIETSNLDNISEWVDTAVQLGANDINDIRFAVSSDRLEDTKNGLITEAIDSAKRKAETAASALGLKVIGVKSIDIEGAASIPPRSPFPLPRADIAAQAEGASPSTPILAGEQQVSTSVSVVFSIG